MGRKVTMYPAGLGNRGRALFRGVSQARDLSPGDREVLVEAARLADRLERLDEILRGDTEVWVSLRQNGPDDPTRVVVDGVLAQARLHAGTLTRLLESLGVVRSGVQPGQPGPGGTQPGEGAEVSGVAALRLAYSSGDPAPQGEGGPGVQPDGGTAGDQPGG